MELVVYAFKMSTEGLGLDDLCLYPALKMWMANGEAIALNLGRGGGCKHTQPSNTSLPLVVKSSERKLLHESTIDL